jgi:hypothetical protein
MTTNVTAPTAEPTQIVVPPRRVRVVSVGLVIAIAFACTSVGFAVGKLSSPPAGISSFSGPGGGGFPAPPGGSGGFPGAPTGP